jgi:hypothetical protein
LTAKGSKCKALTEENVIPDYFKEEDFVEIEVDLIEMFASALKLSIGQAQRVFVILRDVQLNPKRSVLAIEGQTLLQIKHDLPNHNWIAIVLANKCVVVAGEDRYGHREVIDIRPLTFN